MPPGKPWVPPAPEPSALMSIDEAAARLGVSRLTVARHFPTVKIGRSRRVKREYVEGFISGVYATPEDIPSN